MGKEMGLTEKIGNVLQSPTKFFQSVKSEVSVGNAFKYYAVIALIPTAILIIIALVLSSLLSLFTAFIPGSQFFGFFLGGLAAAFFIAMYIAGLVLTFVGAAILHAFAYLFGARKGYENTYKAMIYGSTPAVLLGWIPFIGIIFGIWSLYLDIKGLSILHEISMGRAAGAVLLPVIIIIVLIIAASLFALGTFAPPFIPST